MVKTLDLRSWVRLPVGSLSSV